MAKKVELMSDDYVFNAAECLKLMGHPARIKIVDILSQGKFSVKEIAANCNLPANQTCEHLRLLKNHGLLSNERAGRTVYYQICSTQLLNLLSCIKHNCCLIAETD